jgi:hypothetical protein
MADRATGLEITGRGIGAGTDQGKRRQSFWEGFPGGSWEPGKLAFTGFDSTFLAFARRITRSPTFLKKSEI